MLIGTLCILLTQILGSHLGLGQIAYTRHMSELRIKELHDLATRLESSINPGKYACDSFYDYVCSRHNPLFSIMGQMPETAELIKLMTEIQEDPDQFPAKQKLNDFFISCNMKRSLEDCYREAFAYFKPVFGYIITKNYIDSSSHDHRHFLEILDRFLTKSDSSQYFQRNTLRERIVMLKEKFRTPHMYFRSADLNAEYINLRIYRDGYKHNIRNLEQYRKRNSTFEMGLQRTILDWSLYVFQSRHKPMSYYYPTLNVHLWMTLFNSTERRNEPKYFSQKAECLKLPQFVHALDEARILAVIYLKSFRMAWMDYQDWIASSIVNQQIFDQENQILKQYHLNNQRLFFTLYGQNFCDFGKELAENVFYLGLRDKDFSNIYSCGFQTERDTDCLERNN